MITVNIGLRGNHTFFRNPNVTAMVKCLLFVSCKEEVGRYVQYFWAQGFQNRYLELFLVKCTHGSHVLPANARFVFDEICLAGPGKASANR